MEIGSRDVHVIVHGAEALVWPEPESTNNSSIFSNLAFALASRTKERSLPVPNANPPNPIIKISHKGRSYYTTSYYGRPNVVIDESFVFREEKRSKRPQGYTVLGGVAGLWNQLVGDSDNESEDEDADDVENASHAIIFTVYHQDIWGREPIGKVIARLDTSPGVSKTQRFPIRDNFARTRGWISVQFGWVRPGQPKAMAQQSFEYSITSSEARITLRFFRPRGSCFKAGKLDSEHPHTPVMVVRHAGSQMTIDLAQPLAYVEAALPTQLPYERGLYFELWDLQGRQKLSTADLDLSIAAPNAVGSGIVHRVTFLSGLTEHDKASRRGTIGAYSPFAEIVDMLMESGPPLEDEEDDEAPPSQSFANVPVQCLGEFEVWCRIQACNGLKTPLRWLRRLKGDIELPPPNFNGFLCVDILALSSEAETLPASELSVSHGLWQHVVDVSSTPVQIPAIRLDSVDPQPPLVFQMPSSQERWGVAILRDCHRNDIRWISLLLQGGQEPLCHLHVRWTLISTEGIDPGQVDAMAARPPLPPKVHAPSETRVLHIIQACGVPTLPGQIASSAAALLSGPNFAIQSRAEQPTVCPRWNLVRPVAIHDPDDCEISIKVQVLDTAQEAVIVGSAEVQLRDLLEGPTWIALRSAVFGMSAIQVGIESAHALSKQVTAPVPSASIIVQIVSICFVAKPAIRYKLGVIPQDIADTASAMYFEEIIVDTSGRAAGSATLTTVTVDGPTFFNLSLRQTSSNEGFFTEADWQLAAVGSAFLAPDCFHIFALSTNGDKGAKAWGIPNIFSQLTDGPLSTLENSDIIEGTGPFRIPSLMGKRIIGLEGNDSESATEPQQDMPELVEELKKVMEKKDDEMPVALELTDMGLPDIFSVPLIGAFGSVLATARVMRTLSSEPYQAPSHQSLPNTFFLRVNLFRAVCVGGSMDSVWSIILKFGCINEDKPLWESEDIYWDPKDCVGKGLNPVFNLSCQLPCSSAAGSFLVIAILEHPKKSAPSLVESENAAIIHSTTYIDVENRWNLPRWRETLRMQPPKEWVPLGGVVGTSSSSAERGKCLIQLALLTKDETGRIPFVSLPRLADRQLELRVVVWSFTLTAGLEDPPPMYCRLLLQDQELRSDAQTAHLSRSGSHTPESVLLKTVAKTLGQRVDDDLSSEKGAASLTIPIHWRFLVENLSVRDFLSMSADLTIQLWSDTGLKKLIGESDGLVGESSLSLRSLFDPQALENEDCLRSAVELLELLHQEECIGSVRIHVSVASRDFVSASTYRPC